jgi:hypothetical protein
VIVKVKLILPALLEATDPGFRPIKYALFPPLGLAALAGYLDLDDEVTLEDEHVMPLTLDDEPGLVVIGLHHLGPGAEGHRAASGNRRATYDVTGGMTAVRTAGALATLVGLLVVAGCAALVARPSQPTSSESELTPAPSSEAHSFVNPFLMATAPAL